jgi:FtsH-binding integral membrane protein
MSVLLARDIHPVEAVGVHADEAAFFARTYRWMVGGLTLTGVVASIVAGTPALSEAIFSRPFVFYGLMIAEFAMVVGFAARASRMSVVAAGVLFMSYAALNGLTLSMLFMIYTGRSVAQVFFISAAAFGGLAFYGATTKRDLTAMGHFLFIALIGLVIATVVNLFMRSTALAWITSSLGVVIFAGLTAYDHQKLRRIHADQGDTRNLSLQGALTLYLDFVNLFVQLLFVFGKRR